MTQGSSAMVGDRPVSRSEALLLGGLVAGVLVTLAAAGAIDYLPAVLLIMILGVLVARLEASTFLILLACWLAYQNLLAMALSPVATPGFVKLILASKELVLLVVATIWFAQGRRPRWGWPLGIAVGILSLNLLYLAMPSEAGLVARVAIFRQNTVLVMFFVVTSMLRLDDAQVRRTIRGIIALGVSMALFGFLERFVLGFPFWKAMGVYELAEAKGVASTYIFLKSQIPGNFIFYDFGFPLKRMVGPLADPTLFSHFLALPALLLFSGDRRFGLGPRARILSGLLLLGAMILSLGRGGMLTLLAGMVVVRLVRQRQGRIVVPILAALGLGLLLLPSVGGGLFSLSQDSSGTRHLMGLLQNLEGLAREPLGHGLGTAGNLSLVFGAGGERIGVGESFVGSLAWQLGFPGVLGWALLILVICREHFWPRQAEAQLDPFRDLAHLVGGALVGLFLASLVSESAVAATGSGVYFLLAGAVLGRPPPDAETPVSVAQT